MKKCAGPCGRTLPLTEENFAKRYDNKSGPGFRSACRTCEATRKSVSWKTHHPTSKPDAIPAVPPEEGITFDVTDDNQIITAVSKTCRTLEDALKIAKVDTVVWEVERYVVNKWDCVARVRSHATNSNQFGNTDWRRVLAATELWQVKVWLKRRVQKHVHGGLDLIMNRMKKYAPKYPSFRPVKMKEPHLLEISINDAHFAKMCWARETGDNYDLHIVEDLYEQSVRNLANKVNGFSVDRILLPVGNDFFHIDSPENRTTAGTQQDTDSRYAKMFEVGQMAVIRSINFLLNIAPVEVVWVGGNHDRLSSWHLVHTLKAWFHKTQEVSVDDSPRPRKYVQYGKTLLGYAHGDQEKHLSLPNIMAGEEPHMWAATTFREWHLGHYHKRKETFHTGTDTFEGVIVRVLPSISGRDAWHARMGYMGLRAADAFLFSKEHGPAGQFTSNVIGERCMS